MVAKWKAASKGSRPPELHCRQDSSSSYDEESPSTSEQSLEEKEGQHPQGVRESMRRATRRTTSLLAQEEKKWWQQEMERWRRQSEMEEKQKRSERRAKRRAELQSQRGNMNIRFEDIKRDGRQGLEPEAEPSTTESSPTTDLSSLGHSPTESSSTKSPTDSNGGGSSKESTKAGGTPDSTPLTEESPKTEEYPHAEESPRAGESPQNEGSPQDSLWAQERQERRLASQAMKARQVNRWLARNGFKSVNEKKTIRGVCFSHFNYPLHVAVQTGQPKVVDMLLRAGADPNLEDSDRKTPYEVTQGLRKMPGRKAILALLLSWSG